MAPRRGADQTSTGSSTGRCDIVCHGPSPGESANSRKRCSRYLSIADGIRWHDRDRPTEQTMPPLVRRRLPPGICHRRSSKQYGPTIVRRGDAPEKLARVVIAGEALVHAAFDEPTFGHEPTRDPQPCSRRSGCASHQWTRSWLARSKKPPYSPTCSEPTDASPAFAGDTAPYPADDPND